MLNQDHVRRPQECDAHAEREVSRPIFPEEAIDLLVQLLLGLIENRLAEAVVCVLSAVVAVVGVGVPSSLL